MSLSETENTRTRKKQTRRSGGGRSAQLKQISKSSAQIVKDAAALLDEEVAAGIVAAKQVQQRFQKDRRIDPGDFRKTLKKFQGDAHEVVSLLDDQVSELRSQENTALVKRLLHNTHDVVDLTVELVNMGAEIADQLAQANLKRDANNRKKRSR
jgi:hypothetical protein